MKGALLLSDDPQIFEKICALLVSRGGECGGAVGERVAQVRVKGMLFNAFEGAELEDESIEPFFPEPGVPLPDRATVTGCDLECRSEEVFVALVRDIAALSDAATWILDGNGTVWRAADVDPDRLQL